MSRCVPDGLSEVIFVKTRLTHASVTFRNIFSGNCNPQKQEKWHGLIAPAGSVTTLPLGRISPL